MFYTIRGKNTLFHFNYGGLQEKIYNGNPGIK